MNRIKASGEMLNIRLSDSGDSVDFDIHEKNGNLIPVSMPIEIVPVSIKETCRVRIEGTLETHQIIYNQTLQAAARINAEDIQVLDVA